VHFGSCKNDLFFLPAFECRRWLIAVEMQSMKHRYVCCPMQFLSVFIDSARDTSAEIGSALFACLLRSIDDTLNIMSISRQ